MTPRVGPVHLEDEEHRADDGQRAEAQRGDDGRVAPREQSEADEQHGEPEHEHDQERPRDRVARLLGQQQPRVAETGR